MFNITEIEQEYINFMEVPSFPLHRTNWNTPIKDSICGTESHSFAQTRYDFEKGELVLELPMGIHIPRFVLFHEFTHLYDSSLYVVGSGILPGDKEMRSIGLTVYTEYHASQIEIMHLLKAKTVHDTLSFSMEQEILLGEAPFKLNEYWVNKLNNASLILNSKGCDDEIERINYALISLGNFWGIRSIIEMFANDYSDEYKKQINYSLILPHFDSFQFLRLDELMHGWLNDDKINISIQYCLDIIGRATGLIF